MWKRGVLLGALVGVAWPAAAGSGSERPSPVLTLGAACVLPQPSQEAAAAAAPAPAAPAAAPAAPPPMLVNGLGYSGITPDTADPMARRWFDQGVRFIWAFDEVEAYRAFAEAQRLDPNCSLCAWGEAWSRGPTINLQPRTAHLPKAAAAAKHAMSLAGKLPQAQRELVAAMNIRTGGDGKFQNAEYAEAMAALAREYPQDDAIAVIAADAEMILKGGRNTKEGSNSQRLLETVMARNPNHSGAIHMYIHLTDWIKRPDLAEPHADRLGKLAPSASHLVHMPSHTYYGLGRYRDAAAVNLAALSADNSYVARVRPPDSAYRTGLYAHNSHFIIESALMRGDGPTALEIAGHFARRYPAPKGADPMSVIRAASYYAWGLHGDKDMVLALPDPGEEAPLLRTMRHYARGEALARAGDAMGARAEAQAIGSLLQGPQGRALGGKPIEALAEMTQRILEGRAAMLAGDHAAAVAAYRTGMTLQESAGFGTDPPPFWYPIRRSLGAALLASGDAEGAQRQLVASLREWPRDPLALYALARAERALGRPREAAQRLVQAKAAWSGRIEQVPLSRI